MASVQPRTDLLKFALAPYTLPSRGSTKQQWARSRGAACGTARGPHRSTRQPEALGGPHSRCSLLPRRDSARPSSPVQVPIVGEMAHDQRRAVQPGVRTPCDRTPCDGFNRPRRHNKLRFSMFYLSLSLFLSEKSRKKLLFSISLFL